MIHTVATQCQEDLFTCHLLSVFFVFLFFVFSFHTTHTSSLCTLSPTEYPFSLMFLLVCRPFFSFFRLSFCFIPSDLLSSFVHCLLLPLSLSLSWSLIKLCGWACSLDPGGLKPGALDESQPSALGPLVGSHRLGDASALGPQARPRAPAHTLQHSVSHVRVWNRRSVLSHNPWGQAERQESEWCSLT